MTIQLECRIVITSMRSGRFSVVMCDPLNGRMPEPVLCSSRMEVDEVVRDLKRSIEQAGHRLTFCERSE